MSSARTRSIASYLADIQADAATCRYRDALYTAKDLVALLERLEAAWKARERARETAEIVRSRRHSSPL